MKTLFLQDLSGGTLKPSETRVENFSRKVDTSGEMLPKRNREVEGI